MAEINLSDYQEQIQAYVYDILRESYPEIDPTEHSVIDDLFIKPMNTILGEFYTDLNGIKNQANLSNAESMTIEEMDLIGQGNYYLDRIQGERATATLTVSFLNFDTTASTVSIPIDTFFSTEDGYQFRTITDLVFYGPFDRYKNKKSGAYDFEIDIEAVSEGPDYNVGPNTITRIINGLDQKTTKVTNKNLAEGGSYQEDNVSYAERIKRYYISRQINTAPGYTDLIFDLVRNIVDVLVVGFREDEMMRDLYPFGTARKIPIQSFHIKNDLDNTDINTISVLTPDAGLFTVGEELSVYSYMDLTTNLIASNPSTEDPNWTTFTIDEYPDQYWEYLLYEPTDNDKFVHLGGKVDIYLKGVDISNAFTETEAFSNVLLFPSRYDEDDNLLDHINVCYMTVDANNVPEPVPTTDYTMRKTKQTDFNGAFSDGYTAIFFNPSDISTTEYQIQIFDDNEYNHVVYNIKPLVIKMETPLAYEDMMSNIVNLEIVSIKEITDYNINDFEIVYGDPEFIGTSREECTLTLVNSEEFSSKYLIPNLGIQNNVPNPVYFGLTYKVIDSINSAAKSLDISSNRNLCADVIIRSAFPAQIKLTLPVIIKPEFVSMGEELEGRIKTSILRYFAEIPLGTEMTVTDLLAYLYRDDTVYPFIISINLNNLEYAIVDGDTYRHAYRNGVLPIYRIEYPELNDFSVIYIEA